MCNILPSFHNVACTVHVYQFVINKFDGIHHDVLNSTNKVEQWYVWHN
jgi:hypothetical protein